MAPGALGGVDDAAEPEGAPRDAATPAGSYNPLRYWARPLILAGLVTVLLGLTWWDQRRIPDRPARPDVLTATPAAGATVSASDPGLVDALSRLRTALGRRDARALANLADPEGLVVAAFGGSVPDSGYGVPTGDAPRFSQDILSGAQLTPLNWRNDGRGRVVVLVDGWRRHPLRLSPNSTLELTPLSGIGLVSRAGTWYWRWLLPDPQGVLGQQARSMVWQEWPR
jgi:hypothetical protein